MVQEKNITVISIEELRNDKFDKEFDAAVQWIIDDGPKGQKKASNSKKKIDINFKVLFHGVRNKEGMEGIKKGNFDRRYFNSWGRFGKGAYFTDNPSKSDVYCRADSKSTIFYMFIVNVALGNSEQLGKFTKEY
jgi:hypothetical protein